MNRFLRILLIALFSVSALIILCYKILPADTSSQCLTKRLVFDVGSGSIKTKGYIIDTCANTIIKSLQYYEVPFKLQQCISNSQDGRTIMEECLNQLPQNIKKIEKAHNLDCDKYSCAGIATAWARNAGNTDAIIEVFQNKYGIDVTVIPQEEEGRIAFKAIKLDQLASPYSKEEVIVWDMGGGSLQLTAYHPDEGSIQVYKGKFGTANFFGAVLEHYLGPEHDFSINQELQLYLNKPLAELIRLANHKLGAPLKKSEFYDFVTSKKKKKVFAVGGVFNKALAEDLRLGTNITKQDILNKLRQVSKWNAQQMAEYFESKTNFLDYSKSSILMTYAVMDTLSIDEIEVVPSHTMDYIALDPKYWDKT